NVVINSSRGEGSSTVSQCSADLCSSDRHQYLDDNPTSTPSDVYPISVTVTDDDGGGVSSSTSVTVNNVAPSNLVLNSGTINENEIGRASCRDREEITLDTVAVDIKRGPG